MCMKLCKQKKRKKEKEKYKYYIYYHTYNQSGALGMRQEGENVRGLAETPLFVHIYTGGCQIYSQLAIPEALSLTHYLLYTRIPRHCICLCEVLSTPHSHLYMAVEEYWKTHEGGCPQGKCLLMPQLSPHHIQPPNLID